jgi:hypothetical protein
MLDLSPPIASDVARAHERRFVIVNGETTMTEVFRHLWRSVLLVTAVVAPTRNALGESTVAVAAHVAITPESMVVAGFDAQSASLILTRIDAAAGLRSALEDQEQLAAQSGNALTAIRELLNEAPDDPQLLSQHQSLAQQFEAAQGQLQQLRQALVEAATEGLPSEPIQKLAVWQDGASYQVGPELRTKVRTPEEWQAIELALRAEARANRLAAPLAPEHAGLLAQVRAEVGVIQATLDLQSNLAGMAVVFEGFEG